MARDEATDCGQGWNLEIDAQRPSLSRPLPSFGESSVETTGHIHAPKKTLQYHWPKSSLAQV
jgi:hypothetical protein